MARDIRNEEIMRDCDVCGRQQRFELMYKQGIKGTTKGHKSYKYACHVCNAKVRNNFSYNKETKKWLKISTFSYL